mmetsp:Transcript_22002/g.39425  ORF Transcript_22002/g.39425 Transcript_22002/m.39425 type:complete len:143 (-) Transcript_22002:12-440(-)
MDGTPQSGFSSMGHAREELDSALRTMQDSMTLMAERDCRLHGIEGKSFELQGTSGAFNRQARRLRWEMRWQQYRLMALAISLAVWVSCAYLFREHLAMYFAVSGLCFVLIYLGQRFIMQRWRAQVESEDLQQLLEVESGDLI